ncbi:DUF262 domain-containing protein [Mesorhizobium sp. BH1-1-5]|uniref:DUF262 domain-containing protein n=1 Tax=Mesorhizobium sp. BH1-1-5 TaxID=2876661 RepID=UPI001CCFF7D5|nr:DUF262 domain-containing protein [Mesorhizobium sp. BH1-1-5]MBZ9990195.1 DUF262 domain-containing protein [Mesorhizobium sp. BH1-1-5]
MDVEVLLGDEEADDVAATEQQSVDPDDFFAKNAFRIIYQTNNFFLPQIRDLIEKGEVLNLRPEYQRRLRWTVTQKSKLVESLLLNIPVPPVFLYESDAARYEVMDGQQRLNAVKEFIAGDFALTSLTVLKPLNGIRYSRCPPRIKRALDRASISAIVLLLESDSENVQNRLSMTDIRRFIFDRLNTGGTKLNPQEIRNALNPGPFNSAIVDLTRNGLFTTVFDIPAYVEADPSDYYENPQRQKNTLYSSMGDCQLVLRYFALKDDKNIRGSMRSMLDRAMEFNATKDQSDDLKREYISRFSFLYHLFSGKPFLLPPDEKGRERVSAALYDASMVAIDQLWEFRDQILRDTAGVKDRLTQTLSDAATLPVLTGQGNTAQAVRDRITLMKSIFRPE